MGGGRWQCGRRGDDRILRYSILEIRSFAPKGQLWDILGECQEYQTPGAQELCIEKGSEPDDSCLFANPYTYTYYFILPTRTSNA